MHAETFLNLGEDASLVVENIERDGGMHLHRQAVAPGFRCLGFDGTERKQGRGLNRMHPA